MSRLSASLYIEYYAQHFHSRGSLHFTSDALTNNFSILTSTRCRLRYPTFVYFHIIIFLSQLFFFSFKVLFFLFWDPWLSKFNRTPIKLTKTIWGVRYHVSFVTLGAFILICPPLITITLARIPFYPRSKRYPSLYHHLARQQNVHPLSRIQEHHFHNCVWNKLQPIKEI